jgi:tetratricopeptide (TPR) repeat protein
MFVAIALLSLPTLAAAQPRVIPQRRQIGRFADPTVFQPDRLREVVIVPLTHVKSIFVVCKSPREASLPPTAFIIKNLVGDERDAPWLLKLGQALKHAKSDQAEATFQKSAAAFRLQIDKDPKNARLRLDLIEALYELDRPDEILACARKCVELNPRLAEGWAALGTYYWRPFFRLLYGESFKGAIQIQSNEPPPMITRVLAPAEKRQAKHFLQIIRDCEKKRVQLAPDDLKNVMENAVADAFCALFDNYLNLGKWDGDESAFRAFFSRRMFTALIEYARQKQDPFAYGSAGMVHLLMCKTQIQAKRWTPEKTALELEKGMALVIEPLAKMAEQNERVLATKATYVFAVMAGFSSDGDSLKRFAARTLELAPKESAAIDIVLATQDDMSPEQQERYWMKHSQQYHVARIWERLAAKRYAAGDLPTTERYLRFAEKIDADNRNIQLIKATVLLKRGTSKHVEAGKFLDALEKRLDEKGDPKAIITVADMPTFQHGYRYLRAIHTALSGNWQKGQAELIELRAHGVMTEAIEKALAAFPPPATSVSPQFGRPTLLAPDPRGESRK